MPTPEQFGCTSAECRAMFTYVVWHELAKKAGFGGDVVAMKAFNPAIDFSIPPVAGAVLHHAVVRTRLTATTTSNDHETADDQHLRRASSLIDAGRPPVANGATSSAPANHGGTTCLAADSYRMFHADRRSMPSLGDVALGGLGWDPNVSSTLIAGSRPIRRQSDSQDLQSPWWSGCRPVRRSWCWSAMTSCRGSPRGSRRPASAESDRFDRHASVVAE